MQVYKIYKKIVGNQQIHVVNSALTALYICNIQKQNNLALEIGQKFNSEKYTNNIFDSIINSFFVGKSIPKLTYSQGAMTFANMTLSIMA